MSEKPERRRGEEGHLRDHRRPRQNVLQTAHTTACTPGDTPAPTAPGPSPCLRTSDDSDGSVRMREGDDSISQVPRRYHTSRTKRAMMKFAGVVIHASAPALRYPRPPGRYDTVRTGGAGEQSLLPEGVLTRSGFKRLARGAHGRSIERFHVCKEGGRVGPAYSGHC